MKYEIIYLGTECWVLTMSGYRVFHGTEIQCREWISVKN